MVSFTDWEMCEAVWQTAMGLERQWLQAVTIVFLIYLSKYEMYRFTLNILFVTLFT